MNQPTSPPRPTPERVEKIRTDAALNPAYGHYGCWATANDLLAEIDHLTWELRRTREALQAIRNELGVPQPGCPAPVANAAEIARRVLEEPHDPLA